jgi:uncharacterized membrane protein YoaK (UPF0700 family)
MTNQRLVEMYRRMATEDHPTYRRWLTGNLIVSSLMAGAIVGMAVMGAGRAPDNAMVMAGQTPWQQDRR